MNEAMQPTGLQGKSVSETQKPYVAKRMQLKVPLPGWRHSQSGAAFRDRRMYKSTFCIAASAIRIYTRCATSGRTPCRRSIPVCRATRSSVGW